MRTVRKRYGIAPDSILTPTPRSNNARNLVLFDEAVHPNDEWTPFIHSPIYHALQWVVFKVFGVSLWSMKWVSMLGMTLALAVLLRLLQEEYGPRAMLIGAILFIPSQVLFFMGRSALIEPLLMGIGALTIYVTCKLYQKPKPHWGHALLAGALAGLTLSTKFTGIALVLAPTAFVLFRPPQGRKKLAAFFLAGFAITLIGIEGYLLLTAAPHFLREVAFASGKNAHRSVLHNFLNFPLFFKLVHQQFILIPALLSLLLIPLSQRIRKKQAPPATQIMALAFLLGLLILSLAFYRPFRYFAPLMLPAVYLAVVGFESLLQNQKLRNITPTLKGYCTLLFAGLFSIILFIGPHIKLLSGSSLNYRLITSIIIASLTATLLYRKGLPKLSAKKSLAVLCLLLSGHLYLNIDVISAWVDKPEFSIRDFETRIQHRWKDATIIGNSPNFATIGTQHYGLKWEETGVNETPIGQGQWTHMIVSDHWNNEYYFRRITKEHWKNRAYLGQLSIVHWKYKVYAKSLRPLEIGTTSNASLKNPDPHTSQRIYGLAMDGESLSSINAWDLRPETEASYQSLLDQTGDQHILFKALKWQSILGGGFDCTRTSIHHHYLAPRGKALGYRGKGFINKKYHSVIKRAMHTQNRPSAFIWLSEGGAGASEAQQAFFHQNGQRIALDIFHSLSDKQGQFLSGCTIPGDGTFELQYKHDQPCSMIAWNFQA